MKNARVEVVSDNRGHFPFMGGVNKFLSSLDRDGLCYTVSYAYEGELYVAFITYWKE